MPTFKKILLSFTAALFGLGVYFFLPPDCPEAARRTAFVFVIGAFFWALEIIPLYATSLLVVLLEILLLCRPGGVLNMDASGYIVFLVPFASPVIMLFFGGFVIARVIEKYQIADMAAYLLMRRFGKKPYAVMLGLMCTTAFLSMWMSNTATTAMMLAMLIPLLHHFDQDDPFKTALVLSVAFAANIGGMGTPVGTPPNAIALGLLLDRGIHISFLSWMLMAIPLVMVLILTTALILSIFFKSKYEVIRFDLAKPEPLKRDAWIIIGIVAGTIFLWLTSGWHRLPEALVALLSVGALAIAGFANRKDFDDVDWDILILMWGGLALGKGMEVSGLTEWLIKLPIFGGSGILLIVVFMVLAALLSTFISNTAAANLIMPLAISLPGASALTLTVIVALSCSIAMALPISTPPNAMAFSTDAVKAPDMFKGGIVITLWAMLLLIAGHSFIFRFAFKSM